MTFFCVSAYKHSWLNLVPLNVQILQKLQLLSLYLSKELITGIDNHAFKIQTGQKDHLDGGSSQRRNQIQQNSEDQLAD